MKQKKNIKTANHIIGKIRKKGPCFSTQPKSSKYQNNMNIGLMLSFLFLLICNANSQVKPNPFFEENKDHSAKVFFGTSTGINNMVGILGLQLDVVLRKNITVGAGLGISSWGYKWDANFTIYEDDIYSPYFKIGYSFNTGIENINLNMELANGTQSSVVGLKMKPVNNILATFGWAWKKRKQNRFYFELGYAIPINAKDYYVLSDQYTKLSSTSKKALKILRQGGLIIAVGYNFGK